MFSKDNIPTDVEFSTCKREASISHETHCSREIRISRIVGLIWKWYMDEHRGSRCSPNSVRGNKRALDCRRDGKEIIFAGEG